MCEEEDRHGFFGKNLRDFIVDKKPLLILSYVLIAAVMHRLVIKT